MSQYAPDLAGNPHPDPGQMSPPKNHPPQTHAQSGNPPAQTENSPYDGPDYQAVFAPPPIQLWQDGEYLVAAKGSPFPDRCVKCNAPANGFRLRRKYNCRDRDQTKISLPGRMIFGKSAASVSARFDIGLCKKHRRRRTLLFWFLISLSIFILFLGSCAPLAEELNLATDRFVELGLLTLVSYFCCFFFFVLAKKVNRVIKPTRIDRGYARFKGVSPEFRRQFPRIS